jgi:hypothetical protein
MEGNSMAVTMRIMALLFVGLFCSRASAQTIEELYRKAAQEKTINFYGTLAQVNADKILPVFEKRFPGIRINHVDITSIAWSPAPPLRRAAERPWEIFFKRRWKPRYRCMIKNCCSK